MEKIAQNKKIAIAGTVGVPACYGGFETLAEQMVSHWEDKYDLTVYCSKTAYSKSERNQPYKSTKRVFLPFKANGIQSIIYDVISLFHAFRKNDIIILLGVSAGLFIPLFKLFSKKRLIVNIDGMEWKRGKWGRFTKKFLELSESFAVKYSDVVITDNEAIQDYAQKKYHRKCELIEYGADHVSKVKNTIRTRLDYPFLSGKYAFSVCRIEPENNIHLILEAFSKSSKHYPLVFVGNWEHSGYGKKLKKQFGNKSGMYLMDPIYSPQKLNLLRSNCSLYIHGHSSGGTNPSLVEAMFLGLPVISFDVNYNRITTKKKAFYFKTVEGLSSILENLNPLEIMANGRIMRSLAKHNYSWDQIFSKYENTLTMSLQEQYIPKSPQMKFDLSLESISSGQEMIFGITELQK